MKIAAVRKWFLVLTATLAVAGCATQRINWQARVGNYTYDQAVREFGPPDRRDKLTDGTLIADWTVREGHNIIVPQPYLAPPDGLGPAMPAYSSTYVPSYYMRLTFGPDGQLTDYKNFSR